MRKINCGMDHAEKGCGRVCKVRNAEHHSRDTSRGIPEETTIKSLIFRFIMICVNIFLLHVMLIFGIACLIQLLMLAL